MMQIGTYAASTTIRGRIIPATVWWLTRDENGFVIRSHAETPFV